MYYNIKDRLVDYISSKKNKTLVKYEHFPLEINERVNFYPYFFLDNKNKIIKWKMSIKIRKKEILLGWGQKKEKKKSFLNLISIGPYQHRVSPLIFIRNTKRAYPLQITRNSLKF